jgi:predicted protein tyrosine phosphatase
MYDAGMKRALVICSQNRLRSPTAEQVFSSWADVETDSAGLGGDATVPLSPEQIAWATVIFVMEKACWLRRPGPNFAAAPRNWVPAFARTTCRANCPG